MSFKDSNRLLLDSLAKDPDIISMGYEYIPRIVRQQKYYMEFEELVLDRNVLQIKKLGLVIIQISWSYNEPKVYFTAGPLMVRLTGDDDGLIAAFKGVEVCEQTFNAVTMFHEM